MFHDLHDLQICTVCRVTIVQLVHSQYIVYSVYSMSLPTQGKSVLIIYYGYEGSNPSPLNSVVPTQLL